MKSIFNTIKNTLKQIGYYSPITIYFIVFLLIVIPGYYKLKAISQLPDSAYKAIFSVLLSIALLFCLSILCFALFTTLTSFLYLKWQQRQSKVNLSLNSTFEKSEINSRQALVFKITPILFPLMGFIKLRIRYGESDFSPKFSPASTNSKAFRFSYEGLFHWHLPEIQEYHVDKVLIYIEDFFHFFSFAIPLTTSNRFHVYPSEQNLKPINGQPRKTEETTIRIDELKRIEGELINYKNFESSDDVRRIVWKIYAKNKELVVRTPEIMDPYASHIYFYPSFFTFTDTIGNTMIEKQFLNYYKNTCWSVYKQLLKKGLEVTYIPDQAVPPTEVSNKEERVQRAITASLWHTDLSLQQFVKPGYASVVLVSSLTDKDELSRMAEQYGNEIAFIFVPLSDSTSSTLLTHWLKYIFIQTDENELKEGLTLWNLSPLRLRLLENEKQIKAILKQTLKSEIIEQ